MPVDLERQGFVATVTINRPEALNALDAVHLTALRDIARSISRDRTTRVVVVTGAGERAFVAGADIREMTEYDAQQARVFAQLARETFETIRSAPQPWIAAVNGFALGGGCELALACDLRLAGSSAIFGQPEVTVGIPPGWGATQRLPRLVGPAHAAELIFTGRRVSSVEALDLGLVNAVHPDDQLLQAALDLAERIAANAPLAVAASKRALARADDNLQTGLDAEIDAFAESFNTEDQREGMRAFLAKRPARFTGE